MTIYDQGTVVQVPFPFIEIEKTKTRPALVLSLPEFQQASGACLLAMITRAERSAWPNDLPLSDWQVAGLKKPSVVRWKIFTLDEILIQEKRGILSEPDRIRVFSSLHRIFSRFQGIPLRR